jgi:hypothetical protein
VVWDGVYDMRILIVAALLTQSLTGCTPFAEYEHLSDPRIKGDGYDLICGGIQGGDRLSVSAGICKNLHGGEMIKVNVRVSG